jgi:hypothetical protein
MRSSVRVAKTAALLRDRLAEVLPSAAPIKLEPLDAAILRSNLGLGRPVFRVRLCHRRLDCFRAVGCISFHPTMLHQRSLNSTKSCYR